jgi:signal transduction histidine kinase
VREYGQEISGAGRTLLELVEHLLQVSQIEVGRVVAHRQVFDLGRLLHDQASLLAPQFARKPVKLELDVAPSVRWFSDPGLVRQAVANLLANALKFTPANGCVTCSLTVSDRMAEISIADTGPGIDPADQARIFEAFEQVETTLTRRHGGAGLGLFIARNLIEALKGRLTFVSTAAAGSRFVIRLPADPLQGAGSTVAQRPRRDRPA